MALSLEKRYRLRWLDFDRYGRMKPLAVLDIFQDMATEQANTMGIGHDDMLEKGVFWAVIRSKYEVVKAPTYFQEVMVKTWPHTPTRFSFLRDYSMHSLDGELLIKATSEWVLMDVETRKFVSVKDVYEGSGDYEEARMFERKPRKAPDFDIEGLEPHIIVPAYSDIDVNGHVNNAAYGRFFLDALNPSEEGAIKTFQVDHRYEALPGEPLAVYTTLVDDMVLGKGILENGDISFACAIELA